jgi:hypothetical protein
VLVSGEATGADFLAHYQTNLQKEVEARKKELDTWFVDSMAKMPGKSKNKILDVLHEKV